MQNLIEFIKTHTAADPCNCNECNGKPADQKPEHTIFVGFFVMSLRNNPDPAVLEKLTKENIKGSFCDIDVFNGDPLNYIQLGGWIGDQGLAILFMGLGRLLGLWEFAMMENKSLMISTNKKLMNLVFGEFIIKPNNFENAS